VRDFTQFFAHLKRCGFTPGTVIDVGVAWETASLYDAFPDAWLVLVEPMPHFAATVQGILAERGGRGEFHQVALGEGVGTVEMTWSPDSLECSHCVEHPALRLPDVHIAAATRLDAIFKPDWARPLLLKTDCQGWDIHVLRGAGDTLSEFDVIVSEIGLFEFDNRPDNTLAEFTAYMATRDFVPYDIVGYLRRAADDALGQLDVAFVQRNSQFRKYQGW